MMYHKKHWHFFWDCYMWNQVVSPNYCKASQVVTVLCAIIFSYIIDFNLAITNFGKNNTGGILLAGQTDYGAVGCD